MDARLGNPVFLSAGGLGLTTGAGEGALLAGSQTLMGLASQGDLPPQFQALFSPSPKGSASTLLLGSREAAAEEVRLRLGASAKLPRVKLKPADRRVLRQGARNEKDIQKYRQLLTAIEPEEGGRLVRATKDIPCSLEPKPAPSTSKGGVVFGYSEPTFAQSADRVKGGPAERLSFSVFPDRGASLSTCKHEWTHATAWPDLPPEYRKEFPGIPEKGAPLAEIYRNVLGGRYRDEALAFGAEIRLVRNFEAATGESLYSFAAQALDKEAHDFIRAAYESDGFDGIDRVVREWAGYLPYKIAALYFAILVKQGATDFPDWKNILSLIGVVEEGGERKVDPEALAQFYANFIQPILAREGVNFALRMAGLTPRQRAVLSGGIALFTGSFKQDDLAMFLRKDMDELVEIIGFFMGDEASGEDESSPGPGDGRPFETAEVLEPVDKPIRKGDPEEINRRPEVVMDKVRLIGGFIDFLYRLDRVSDAAVINNFREYIIYAEETDPASSARVYSRLMGALDRHKEPASNERMSLGISMIRSGHAEAGRAQCLKAGTENLRENFPGALLHLGEEALVEEIFEEALRKDREGEAELLQHIGQMERGETPWQEDAEDAFQSPRIYPRSLALISKLGESEHAPTISEPFRARMEACLRRCWELEWGVFQAKTALYRKVVKAGDKDFESIDELFAIAPQFGDDSWSSNDYARVLGGAWDVLFTCFSSPRFFRLGMEFLEVFPDSVGKCEVFDQAAGNFPDDFSDEERKAFVLAYRRTIRKQEKALHRWSYQEDILYWTPHTGWDDYNKKPLNIKKRPLHETHFYARHMGRVAEILLHSPLESGRAEGRKLLRDGLSQTADCFHNRFHIRWEEASLPEIYRTHIPSFWRGYHLLKHLDAFPASEKKEILEELIQDYFTILFLSSFFENSPDTSYYLKSGKFVWDIAARAHLLGFSDLVTRIISNWKKTEILTKTVMKKEKMGLYAPRQWASFEKEAFFLSSLFNALMEGGDSVENLIGEMERDVDGNRRRFTPLAAVRGLKILNQAGRDEKEIIRLAEVTLQFYIQDVGRTEGTLMEALKFEDVVRTLRELNISPAAKDNLFVKLIETATPREGAVAGQEGAAGAIWNAARALEFIIDNGDMPRSEGLLLRKLAEALEKLPFNRSDPKTSGAVEGLAWLFKRLATDALLGDSARGRLEGLSDEASYTNALSAMDRYAATADEQDSLSPEGVANRYRTAISRSDGKALAEIEPAIRSLLSQELNALWDQWHDGRRWQYVPMPAFTGSLFQTVYSDWRLAESGGNGALAKSLFPIWAGFEEIHEIAVKRLHIYGALADPRVSLEVKRELYGLLKELPEISPYKANVWEELVRRGEREREEIFYQMTFPKLTERYFSPLPDELVALGMALPVGEARKLAKRYALCWKEREQTGKWEPDMRNGYDRDIHLYTTESNMEQEYAERLLEYYFAAGLFRAGITVEEILEGVRQEELDREEGRDHWELVEGRAMPDWKRVWGKRAEATYGEDINVAKFVDAAGQISTFGGDAEELILEYGSVELLARFQVPFTDAEWKQHKNAWPLLLKRDQWLRDQVQIAAFKMPAVFANRDPLTQFLLSRFFMAHPTGERQVVLQGMEGVSEEEALRLFFEKTGLEKVAQFLSFCPWVPEAIRRELAHLQDNIAPSDFSEVIQTLRNELEPGEETDAIISNMEHQPIGSGSIGECYRSRTLSGEEVVIKIIPPSKEAKFNRALERLQELGHLLDVYKETLPGSDRAADLVFMFLDLVKNEFDLRVEKENADYFRATLPAGIKIPEYHRATRRVAVQSFIAGKRLDAIQNRSLREQWLAGLKVYLWGVQVLQLRRCHTDIQPGNLLGDEERGDLYLIDFGQIGDLKPGEQQALLVFVNALTSGKGSAIAGALESMGEKMPHYNSEALATVLSETLAEGNNPTGPLALVVNTIFDQAYRHGLRVFYPYLILLKGMATFEATAGSLA